MPDSTRSSLTFCEIITALIRVVAIKLALESITFLSAVVSGLNTGQPMRNGFILFGFLLVCIYWLWHFSPFLARHITRGGASSLTTSSLTLIDLYSFAF